ncbi:MAG: hypothetical protein CMC68_03185 [Flavobacteriaceae bacterium]|nr:hypothetical protein [Flavobacteriaceae bacterium]
MSNPTPINITVTVDTDNITEENKNYAVVFSQGLGGPIEQPGHPENYTSQVEKNQNIIWTAVPLSGNTEVFFQDVKHKSGKEIMQTIKRGDGHNVFTAKIKNGNFNPDDEEKYSITIGLNGYEGIAGSNENGPMVYLGKTVAYMDSYQDNVWHVVAEAPFEIEGIAGYNTSGAIIYSGNRVAYMNGFASNQWVEINPAPFPIQGITGENSRGVIVYNGSRVAYIDNYNQGILVEVANAPFDIEGIAGDNLGGPIVYAGNKVQCMMSYNDNRWQYITDAPVEIEGISGTYRNGTVIYGGNKVYRSNDGIWTAVANAPYDSVEGIAGNSVRGPIIFSGPQLQYMYNYNENAWHSVAAMPFSTRTFIIDPKLQIRQKT